MTVVVDLPDEHPLELEHLILDVNGTLTHRGRPLDGVAAGIMVLRESLSVRLLTADTFGTAIAGDLGTPIEVVAHGDEKLALLERLGPARCAAIGNGRSDVQMLRAAALGLAVIGPEGASAEALAAADVVCSSILDALALLASRPRS
jgi:soluble P-type ATPase